MIDKAESSKAMWSSPHLLLSAMGVTGYKSEINLHSATKPTLGGGDSKLAAGEQKNRRRVGENKRVRQR